MIQTINNNYNINFKSARVKKTPHIKMPKEVRKLIMIASNTSDIRNHVDALNRYGIRITGYRVDEEVENRVHMCYNTDTIDPECAPGTLTIGAVGEISDIKDARTIMFDTIRDAWEFFLRNASEYDFFR